LQRSVEIPLATFRSPTLDIFVSLSFVLSPALQAQCEVDTAVKIGLLSGKYNIKTAKRP